MHNQRLFAFRSLSFSEYVTVASEISWIKSTSLCYGKHASRNPSGSRTVEWFCRWFRELIACPCKAEFHQNHSKCYNITLPLLLWKFNKNPTKVQCSRLIRQWGSTLPLIIDCKARSSLYLHPVWKARMIQTDCIERWYISSSVPARWCELNRSSLISFNIVS